MPTCTTDIRDEFWIELHALITAGRLILWDADSKTLKAIESGALNGSVVRLNAEKWHA